jgi:hypothetical protein
MQGFIININRVKDEDLIVSILSQNGLETLYRFYGARHGSINIGFLIDFEKEKSQKSTISRLKDVIHIGFKWIHDYYKLRLWQDFIKLFYPHLKDTYELDSFYFDLLLEASQKWSEQNPKRVAIESYVKLLEFEGRLHTEMDCFLCGNAINGDISLVRAFLPTHKECSHTLQINKKALMELYKTKSSIFLSDMEIDRMWIVLLEGL